MHFDLIFIYRIIGVPVKTNLYIYGSTINKRKNIYSFKLKKKEIIDFIQKTDICLRMWNTI